VPSSQRGPEPCARPWRVHPSGELKTEITVMQLEGSIALVQATGIGVECAAGIGMPSCCAMTEARVAHNTRLQQTTAPSRGRC
jgi:hypothetical protein